MELLLVMALAFGFPKDVTEIINRYTIGYPRDRLRAIAADVVRTEISKPFWKIQVRWSGAGLGRFCLTWPNMPGVEGHPGWWKYLESDREYEVQRLQYECEPCEPAELQSQRTCF